MMPRILFPDFAPAFRKREVTPPAAADTERKGGYAIDAGTIRHPRCAAGRKFPKCIEEDICRMKTGVDLRKIRDRGSAGASRRFIPAADAENPACPDRLHSTGCIPFSAGRHAAHGAERRMRERPCR